MSAKSGRFFALCTWLKSLVLRNESGFSTLGIKHRTDSDRIDEATQYSRTFTDSDLKDLFQMYVDLAETLKIHDRRITRLEDDPGESWKQNKA